MARLELDVETPVAPERVREALIDFSERRPDIWPGLERSLYEVYSVGETTAEVKEGSKLPGMTVWAREHYDWSDPRTVRWTVKESNFSTPGDYVAATLDPREGGGTRVHVEWERTGTTRAGRFAVRAMTLTKGRAIGRSMEKGFRQLEDGRRSGAGETLAL